MIVKDISLTNFRNYRKLDLQFHEKVNLILGENAQGKTNLLEAIYISSFGKSFRTSKDSEMIRFNEPFCKVKILAERREDEKCVEILIGKEEKAIKIDGLKIKKTSELMNNILIVIFSPEDLKIVKDDPEKRRRFIDKELCQIKPSYYANLSSYKRVLIQRNASLKGNNPDMDICDVWDEKLVEYGSKLISERNRLIEKINPISNKIHKKITNGKENLEITYEASVRFYKDPQEQKEQFNSKLKSAIKKDAMRGTTSFGPHRDDLKICVNDMDIRRFGSQGQQRSAALSMKLAELALIEEETGEKAILLLDDVLSELDYERQKFLVNSLESVQLFITTTEISDHVKKSLPSGYTFYINEGKAQ